MATKKVSKKSVKKNKDEEEEKDVEANSIGAQEWSGPENPSDGDVVTLGETVYRFKNTMEQSYDVQIGVDAKESLKNLDRAVKQNGESGVHYFEGTRGQSLVPLNITL